MRKIITMIILVASFFMLGCSSNSKPPIKVTIGEKYSAYFDAYYPIVDITSLVDDISISDVIVNKGNCKPVSHVPQKLKYGESYYISFFGCSNILKVKVVTNKGEWSWYFTP